MGKIFKILSVVEKLRTDRKSTFAMKDHPHCRIFCIAIVPGIKSGSSPGPQLTANSVDP
jgi:hypothetical protein